MTGGASVLKERGGNEVVLLLTSRLIPVTIERLETRAEYFQNGSICMNTVVSEFTAFEQDVPLAQGEVLFKSETGASPAFIEELVHELRQPLGVIETLAYYIELTTTDENIAPRIQHIQSMLAKVHSILESASFGHP